MISVKSFIRAWISIITIYCFHKLRKHSLKRLIWECVAAEGLRVIRWGRVGVGVAAVSLRSKPLTWGRQKQGTCCTRHWGTANAAPAWCELSVSKRCRWVLEDAVQSWMWSPLAQMTNASFKPVFQGPFMGMQRETQEAHDSLAQLEEICLPLLAGGPPPAPTGHRAWPSCRNGCRASLGLL